MPPQNVEGGHRFAWDRKKDRDGSQRKRQGDERTLEGKADPQPGDVVGNQDQQPRQPERNPGAIGEQGIREDERDRNDDLDARVKDMYGTVPVMKPCSSAPNDGFPMVGDWPSGMDDPGIRLFLERPTGNPDQPQNN